MAVFNSWFLAGALVCAAPFATEIETAIAAESTGRVTIIYDAFGKDPAMTKDWGFSALIEIAGKRILFDTGNDCDIFAANVKAKAVDLTSLDFVVMSHRHADHMGDLSYVLSVNPKVKIYAPKEGFGIYGSSLPSSFYRKDQALLPEMRYYARSGALRPGRPKIASEISFHATATITMAIVLERRVNCFPTEPGACD